MHGAGQLAHWRRSPAPCPVVTLTPTTDATQAAGLINLALSQPGISSFLLHVPSWKQPGGGKGGNPLGTALAVIMAARKINAATQHKSDLAMLPSLTTLNAIQSTPGSAGSSADPSTPPPTQESFDVHVYRLAMPGHVLAMQGQSVRVDFSSSPLVLALQVAQGVAAGSVVNVMFGPGTAATALHALAQARASLTASNQDAVLVPQQLDASPGGASGAFPYLVKAIPTALLLQVRACSQAGSPALGVLMLALGGGGGGQSRALSCCSACAWAAS